MTLPPARTSHGLAVQPCASSARFRGRVLLILELPPAISTRPSVNSVAVCPLRSAAPSTVDNRNVPNCRVEGLRPAGGETVWADPARDEHGPIGQDRGARLAAAKVTAAFPGHAYERPGDRRCARCERLAVRLAADDEPAAVGQARKCLTRRFGRLRRRENLDRARASGSFGRD